MDPTMRADGRLIVCRDVPRATDSQGAGMYGMWQCNQNDREHLPLSSVTQVLKIDCSGSCSWLPLGSKRTAR